MNQYAIGGEYTRDGQVGRIVDIYMKGKDNDYFLQVEWPTGEMEFHIPVNEEDILGSDTEGDEGEPVLV
jgi:hypothetical protein